MFEKLLAVPDQFYTPQKRGLSPLAYLFLLMLCVAFFTPGLITMPPTDRDESSFAQASKQMIETGNLTDIKLQDAPRYKKPIGIYWLQVASVRAFNPEGLNQIWAYRLPSFTGATVAVLMTAALGSLLFGPLVGLMAAMMLAGSVLLNVEARLAKTDAALLGCVLIVMYGLARAYLGSATRLGVPAAFWTALACGVLIKGPIILLPLCGTLLWLKVSDKNISWAKSLRPLLGIPYALALIAPWFIAITVQSQGAFIEQAAGHDMLAKLWQGQNRGIMPPGLHLLALPIVFFPFALFAVFAVPDIWKHRKDPAIKFCLGWAVPTWIVFELSFTKLPHYVLPAYPAIALLAAKFLLDGFPTIATTTRQLPIALIIGFWLMLGTGFALLFALLPVLTDGKWELPQIAAGIVLLLSQALCLLLLPKQKASSMIVMATGSLIFITTVFGATIPNLQHIWMSREIVEAVVAVKPCPHYQIVATGYHEPSLVFLGGTDTILASNGLEAANSLKEDSCRVAVIDTKNNQQFLEAFSGLPQQPRAAGSIEGLNSGHGSQALLTLYLMPPLAP